MGGRSAAVPPSRRAPSAPQRRAAIFRHPQRRRNAAPRGIVGRRKTGSRPAPICKAENFPPCTARNRQRIWALQTQKKNPKTSAKKKESQRSK